MNASNGTSPWSSMADQFMNNWTEAGNQMWKNWFDFVGSATRNPAIEAKPGMDSLVQRFVENQELLLRLLRLSFNTWQEIFPKVQAGENWQQTLSNYTDQVRTQLQNFSTGSVKSSQDAAELWKLYLQETQKFSQLWMNALGASVSPLSQAALSSNAEPWIELNNLYWNLLYEETYGSLMQSPLLGPTREFNGKLLRAFDAWMKLYRSSLDFQVVLADVQVRSFEELMRQLVSMAEKGESIKDWRQFQQLWGQVADDVFEKAFCNETNLRVRGRFINSLNTYRLHQQELMELWMKTMNIPTRSEVDEVHKNIYELRKEVKMLRKKLAAYEAQVQVTAPVEPEATTEAPESPAEIAAKAATRKTSTRSKTQDSDAPSQTPTV